MLLSRRQFGLLFGSATLLAQPAEVDWIDARTLTLEGLGYSELKSPYDRFPARAEGVVRPDVWMLSRDSAGVLVRFTANTSILKARWTLVRKSLAGVNMTAIGASGLDLYTKFNGKWRWLGVGRPTDAPEIEATLVEGIPAGQREYLLYLPLYNGVTSLSIGVAKGSAIAASPRRDAKPVVFYGTSITQGASATRPGMVHTAILGRTLNRPIINLGFSGNGRMEPEVMNLLSELDPAVFVLDCLPNMVAKDLEERAEVGIRTLRAAHPRTPILLVEDRNYPEGFLIPSRKQRNDASQAVLRKVYANLQAAKMQYIGYVKAEDLLGDDGEATTDGSHPSDLGFVRQAAALEGPLRKLLSATP